MARREKKPVHKVVCNDHKRQIARPQINLSVATKRRLNLLSIPGWFEPVFRSLRATIPVFSEPPYSLSFILYLCTFGVNTDEGGQNNDQIS